MRILLLLLVTLVSHVAASRNELASILSLHPEPHYANIESVITSTPFTTSEIRHLETLHSFTLSTGGRHGDVSSHPFQSSSRHEIIQSIPHTSTNIGGLEVPHGEALHIAFNALGEEFNYHLTPMYGLMNPDSVVEVHGENGLISTHPMKLQSYYLHADDEWVSLTIHPDGTFSSVIRRNGEVYQVDPVHTHYESMQSEHHYNTLSAAAPHGMTIFKHSDLIAEGNSIGGREHTCGSVSREGVEAHARGETISDQHIHKHARHLLAPDPFNCGQAVGATGYAAISMGQVVDYGMFLRTLSPQATAAPATPDNIAKATAYVQSVYAMMNSVYAPQLKMFLQVAVNQIETAPGFGAQNEKKWNVQPAIPGLRCDSANAGTINPANPAGAKVITQIQTTLTDFSTYVRTQKAGQMTLWHHMTNCYPPGGVIGIAYVGTMCTTLRTGVSTFSGTTWLTMAHEIGHNFGADHTFQLGQGKTGGIMDYGDGRYKGEFQFNVIYSRADICGGIQGIAAIPGGARNAPIQPFCFQPLQALPGANPVIPGQVNPPPVTPGQPTTPVTPTQRPTIPPPPPVVTQRPPVTVRPVATLPPVVTQRPPVVPVTPRPVPTQPPATAPPPRRPPPDGNLYKWAFTPWSACSATCEGTRTRQVVCVNANNLANLLVVPPQMCIDYATNGPQPISSEACGGNCPVKFVAKPGVQPICTSASGATCAAAGVGQQAATAQGTISRPVQCVKTINGKDQVVADQVCINQGVAKPANTNEVCNLPTCPGQYTWAYTRWLACSKECDGGLQTRIVACIQVDNKGNVAFATDANGQRTTQQCDTLKEEKPVTQQACNTQACIAGANRYVWTFVDGVETFGPCSAPCAGGLQTRKAYCTDRQTNQIIPNNQCPNMPILERPCNTQACGVYVWNIGVPGPCNATCGDNAYYTRKITCINNNDPNKTPVTNTSLCLGTERPSDTVKCATQACPTTPTTPVTPTQAPPAPVTPTASYTAAQVAQHATRTDCWVSIGTDVYDVTRFVATHPGGIAEIAAICGKAADASIQGKHPNPANVLSKVAPLKNGKLTTGIATYTVEVVAKHATVADCWSIIDGKVYDLSNYGQDAEINPDAHPGGASVIIAGCGKDVSKQFKQYHAADVLTQKEIIARVIGQIGTGGASVPSTPFPPPIGTQQYAWYIDTVQVACGAAPAYTCTVVNTSPARCVIVNGAKLTGIAEQYCDNQPVPATDPRQPRVGQPCLANANPCPKGKTNGALHHVLSAVGSTTTNNVHPLHRRVVHVLATGTGTGPQWLAGPFGTCTRMCDGGSQVRNVTCVDGATGAQLALSECDATSKPAETSECGMMACSAFWSTSEWNECSDACGGLGNQTRTVQCRSSASPDGLGVVVADSECAMVAAKPSESQQCNAQPCPKWEGKQWSECSVPCGAGHKTLLDAKCVNQYGILLPDSECVTKSQFNAMVPCNNGPCPVYDHLPWEPCSQTCGGGMQNRTVYCRTQNKGDITGRIEYNMTICDMYDGDGRKQGNHVTSQTCNEQPCGPLYWKIMAREECSKQCGGGARRVKIACMRMDANGGYTQVEDKMCETGALIQKPLEIENCNEQACAIEYGWAPGTWGQCSSFCGTGVQTREVNCINLITKELTPGKCPPSSQFATTQPCTEKVEKCYGNVRIGDAKNGECITDPNNAKKGTCQCRPGFAGSDCSIEPAITAVFFENTRYAAGIPVGANEKVIIRWDSLGSSEQVSLILVRDDPKSFFAQYIARAVINSGVYEWNVGQTLDDLPFADNYVVRVVTKHTVYGQTERFSTADKCQYVTCGANALCQSGKCVCQPGYSGPQCQITPCMKAGCDVDRSTCDNTQANPTCVCNNGWTGPTCRTPKVCSMRCDKGDLAIPEGMPIAGVAECPLADADLTCQCQGQWSGKTCNTCGLQCMNGGTPDTTCSACVCKPGWTGPTCGCRYYDVKASLNYDTSAWDRSPKPYSASTRRFQQTFANDVAAAIPGFNANQVQFTAFNPTDKSINIDFQLIEQCSSISSDLLMNDFIKVDGVHIAFDSVSNTMDEVYKLFLQQLRNKESTLLTGVLASSIVDGSVSVADPLAVNGAQPEQPGKPSDPFGVSPVNAGIYESKSEVNVMLIGIIVGAVVGVILAVLALIYFMRARKSSTRTLNKVTTEQMPTSSPHSASTTPRSTAFTAEGQPNGVMPMQQRVQHVYGA